MLRLRFLRGRMNQEPDATDRQLVAAVLTGDVRATDVLVTRLCCVPRILATLNHRTGGWMTAEDLGDLAQDVLLTLWKRLDTYTGQAGLETWIYGFCYHEFMNAMRKRQRRGEMRSVVEPGTAQDAPPRALEYEGLYRSLEALDGTEGRVIRLKHFDELTFDEIGTRLQVSSNTAKTIYYRGMKRLGEHMRRSSEEVAS